MTNKIRKGRLFFVICALVLVVTLSLTQAWASYQSMRSDFIVAQWERGKPVQLADWQQAKKYIESALFWSPERTDYFESNAEIHHWRSAVKDVSKEELDRSLEVALRFYRLTLKKRPLWPYSWANMALLKSQLRQWDAELLRAVNSAVELGPWETSVQLAVHEAGLIGWHQFKPDSKAVYLKNYRRGLKNDRRTVNALLTLNERYGAKAAFCFYAQQHVLIERNKVLIAHRCKES